MLKVWGRRSSANVQKVMWLIGELGIPHEHIPAGGTYGRLNTPEFLLKNPHGLVPVIEDHDTVVWESNAVVRYLAARYGGPRFWHDTPEMRAQYDQWMDWAATTFQPDIIGLFWSFWRTSENQRNWDQIRTLEERTERDLHVLDDILARRPFVAGDLMTLADIPTGVHLYRYYTMGITVPPFPNVEAWYGRLKQRAAYREHVMVSYEELRGRLTF
jgi:glutathione S-transferase